MVPTTMPAQVIGAMVSPSPSSGFPGPSIRARPKSSTFTRPSCDSMTLPGLRSRCVTCFWCAAASASARGSAISRKRAVTDAGSVSLYEDRTGADGVRFLTMELVDGTTLDQILAGKGLPLYSSHERQTIMKRAVAHSVVLVSALGALSLAQTPLAAGAKEMVRHTVLATSGGAAPTGGNYVTFTRVALNARSQMAFDASLGGPSTSGVFLTDGSTTSAIALGGNPDPAAANFAFVDNPFVTSHGDVVFDVDFSDTVRADGRNVVPLVRNGDPAPDGGTLTPFTHAMNRRGTIAYRAQLSGAAATMGILRTDGEQTVAIVRDDSVAPI